MKKQPDKGKITALYERLSHDDERAGESVSIENQKRILEDYAQKNGFTNIRHFTDDGVRGTTFKRPGLDAMLEEIRAGNVATVIIKDQSRIGRDVVEVGLLKRTFDEYHVRFIAANDNLDTANGFDIMSIFRDVINEWYVADNSRKIKTVFKSRMEKGLRCSGSVSYSSQFVSRGMCVDFAIHDTGSGNPHCHIMLTMRPLDERGAWAAKSKKEYDLDENGERIRLPSGRYKTHKVDLTGWNDKGNALLWRKAWADISNAYLERAGSPERIDHRSNAERGIDELPTVHMGVAACQMEKKGIATEKGELNRNIQKANRLIREIRAQIGKLKEWIGELFKARETAPEQPPQSPGLANLLMKYLSVQREKSRKYSQSWQRQHAADELKTVAAAVNYLSEHGISTLDELDAALSSVSEQADAIREGMKTAEKRMKELQKLMEYGRNYQTYKPIQDEYRQIRWKGKQEKFAEARRAELTLWDAANRYLHAHLPEGVKTLPISAWEKEYTALKAQREAEYETLKDTRAEVAELQKIRKCVDIALRADQPAQTQSRTKRQEQER